MKNQLNANRTFSQFDKILIETSPTTFGIKPFFIEMGNELKVAEAFKFDAPTSAVNTLRLLRGLQLNKAILLEGSPGVGKTSLVTALAKATRNRVLRINLSDQTVSRNNFKSRMYF